MRDLCLVLTTVGALFVAPAVAAAQEGSVTGRVTDASTGEPLSAVQIFVQGTNVGTLTGEDGQYLLTGVPVGERNISALIIGYGPMTETVTVTAEQAASLDFQLSSSAIALDAVVVTATGEQRKVELGNALGSINVEQVIDMAPIATMSDLLKGRSAGVMVATSSGTTGMGSRVRIRGSSSLSLSNNPLVYVDGIRIDSDPSDTGVGTGGQDISRLDDINPEDIESIEIVKGPSAATLYGTEAANGVIRITTKQGRSGDTRWNLWTEYGQIDDENDYPLNYRGLDANNPNESRRENCRIDHVLEGECTQTGVSAYSPLYDPELTPLVTGQRRQYGASVGGGSGGVTYFLSGEFEEEQGPLGTPEFYFDDLRDIGVPIDEDVVNPNRFERQSFRANVTAQVAENATAGLRMGYISAIRRFPINDNSALGLMPSAFFGGAFPDRPERAWGFRTPAQVLGRDNQQDIERFTTSVTGTVSPVTWLTLRGTGGLDFSSQNAFAHQYPGLDGPNDDGGRSSNFDHRYQYTVDLSGTGTFDVTPSVNSRSTLGFQFFHDINHGVGAFGDNLVPGSESVGTAAETSANEGTAENKTLGVFFEQQFGINDRLFVTGAVRADDNSAFGQEFDLIWYPKASVSWVASDEAFFPELGWVEMLRLRGAWGASGRQPGSTAAIRTLSVDAIADPDDQIVNGVVLGGAGNVNLKPERSDEIEMGLDADLFDGRAGLELTWFNRVTSDILVTEPLPPSLGSASSRFQNLGEAETNGFEIGVNGAVIETDNVTWDLNLSGSFITSNLNELGLPGIDRLGSQVRHQEGFPLGAWWDIPYTWSDANGDGIIAESELTLGDSMVFIAPGLPEREFSLSSTLRLGRYVQLYAMVDHQADYASHNNTEGFRCQFRVCRPLHDVTAPLWDQARAVAREFASPSTEHGYIEDGDFFKLREVSVTLFAPEQWTNPIRSSRAALTISGRNLVTWTDYTGVDPELNRSGSGDNFGTEEFLTQGIPRYITARLSLTF